MEVLGWRVISVHAKPDIVRLLDHKIKSCCVLGFSFQLQWVKTGFASTFAYIKSVW